MGEIMEISGLGQDTGYVSFLSVRVTRGGAPYVGPVAFTDDDSNKVIMGKTDSGGVATATIPLVKTSSITVSIPGMENVKTAHGLTVASTPEAEDPANQVTLDLPGASVAPTMSSTVLMWAIPVAVVGLIGFFIWKRNRKAILDGLGWLGIIKPCGTRERKRGRAMRSQRWCLMDRRGKRVLGRHSSKRKARRQERLIEMKKHGIKTRR